MNDFTFRNALKETLLAPYMSQPDTILLEELNLWEGETRVDVALVNGILHGYEIKSDTDTLLRLPQQVMIYSSVLDQATLVVAKKHLNRALEILPLWWGVEMVTQNAKGEICFDTVRIPDDNPGINALAVAQLLWRDEALCLLEELDAAKGYRSKSRQILHKRIADVASLDAIRDCVRLNFKKRINWRVVSSALTSGD